MASMVTSVMGTGMSMWSSYMAGRAAKQAANYNAAIKEQKRELIGQAMAAETTEGHKQARKMKASQRAAYLKGGTTTSSGTSLAVLVEQAGKMEGDIMERRRTRMLQMAGLTSEAAQLRYQGKLAAMGAGASAGASAMSGASDAISKYQAYQAQPSNSSQQSWDSYNAGKSNSGQVVSNYSQYGSLLR